jgi:hypothetical protein
MTGGKRVVKYHSVDSDFTMSIRADTDERGVNDELAGHDFYHEGENFVG